LNLEELLTASSLNFTEKQIIKADAYIDQILKWNKTRNLVSRKLTKNDLAEHFLDCAALQKLLKTGSVIDLGSGPGFPGICLAIIDPKRKITLVDSNRKKTTFLTHVKNELELNSVIVRNERVEHINRINDENIVCRAFKEPEELVKGLKDKITKKNKITLMVSRESPVSFSGFDAKYTKSEASDILGKKRGFLEIQKS
jgi:16S rRNA (guanine527-N7)-methyltransferase